MGKVAVIGDQSKKSRGEPTEYDVRQLRKRHLRRYAKRIQANRQVIE